MDRSLNLVLRDAEFIFDCRRMIYWPEKKTLIGADLHWGKTQFLRNHGIAISDNVFDADLKRLEEVINDYQAERVLVLGDLIHHEKALTKGMIEKVAHFRDQVPCEMVLLKGNHDRYTKFPESWGIVEEKDLLLGDFSFRHEHVKDDPRFQFSGHLHPTMRLRAGHDYMRLPAFVISDEHCLLPAFSHLTGGQDVKLKSGEKAIVMAEDGVTLLE